MTASLAQPLAAVPSLLCPPKPPKLDSWPRSQDLSDFNQWMACLGSRFTATPAHKQLLVQIDEALHSLVQAGVLKKETVPVSFENWEAKETSLTLINGPNMHPVGYMPFSGLTPANGVTAELVFQRPGFWKRHIPLLNLGSPLKIRKRHAGKIVAFWVPTEAVPKCLVKYAARSRISDFSDWAPYRRPITLEIQAPCLNKARKQGVKGVVLVLDMSRPHAEGQYLPFTRKAEPAIGGVPGLHVDRDQREALENHADKGGKATLVLEGKRDLSATSEHLIYTLPGANSGCADEEIVLIQTHTDGPGAVEENGVMALIALAHRFASVPKAERPRTLVFLFATGHFVKAIEGAKDVVWKHRPAWFSKTKVAVAIEHLGSKEWEDGSAGYGPRNGSSGKTLDEPVLLFVPGNKHPLAELAAYNLPLARKVVIPARGRTKTVFGRKVFGEGQYVACAGVPTVGYVPNPDYMFSYADPGGSEQPGHFEKLDPARMLSELEGFRSLIWKLMTEPLHDWPKVTPNVTKCKEAKSPCS